MADTPTPRLPRAERRQQVLRAAAAVFARTGFDGTSMDDVARAAGVTRLIVYRIFGSKHDLYVAVLAAVADDLRAAFVPPPTAPPPSPPDVARLLLDVARRHPDGFRLLWRQAAHEPEFATWAATFRAVVDGFAEARLAELVGDRVLRRWAARSIVAYLYEGVCLWLDEGAAARDEEVLRALRDGVRAMIATWQPAAGATAVAPHGSSRDDG